MAKNYTLTEAIIIAHENGDMEALADLGRRYPLLMAKVMRLVTKAGEEAVDLAQYFPAYLSANKMNKAIKEGNVTTGSDDEDDADVEDEDDADEEETPKKKAPAPKGKPAKGKKDADDADDSDYNSMSSRELWQLLGKLNARKACEEEFGDLKKGSMVKYLEKHGETAVSADDDADDDEAEETGDNYEGKSAMDLYKLCKSRKIKAEPKKPAKYYIGLLKKADEAAAAAEDAEDDEEWDDDEEEDAALAKKPAKTDKKAAKPAEKPAPKGKKKVDEDDDDDEWEI